MRRLADFKTGLDVTPAAHIGERSELCLLPLDRLVIDDAYQRRISGAGRAHVKRIAETFDWRKFTPVVVAPSGDGLFAIIDGQHRATAALLHPAIDMVPCMVVKATPTEAAACFAAINGAVTKLTKQQIHRARVVAGDAKALEIDGVCRAAGVVLLTNKETGGWTYKPGETFALGAIERCLKSYGRDLLITALKAVVESAGGNAGNLRASVIYALCDVLSRRPSWVAAGGKLIDAMDEIDLGDLMDEATSSARKAQVTSTQKLTELLEAGLARQLDGGQVVTMRRRA